LIYERGRASGGTACVSRFCERRDEGEKSSEQYWCGDAAPARTIKIGAVRRLDFTGRIATSRSLQIVFQNTELCDFRCVSPRAVGHKILIKRPHRLPILRLNARPFQCCGHNAHTCQLAQHGLSPDSSSVGFVNIRVLRRRFAHNSEHSRIACPWHFLA